ncbi:MAG: hypothetical protein WBQ62_01015 [Dehalococcoidales bacterium]|jgi:hypothetical protein
MSDYLNLFPDIIFRPNGGKDRMWLNLREILHPPEAEQNDKNNLTLAHLPDTIHLLRMLRKAYLTL